MGAFFIIYKEKRKLQNNGFFNPVSQRREGGTSSYTV